MPAKWDKTQEDRARTQIEDLYCKQNLTISDIARRLGVAQSTVYARMCRLGIVAAPERKPGYRNIKAISLPDCSVELAELIGILLGDGHISPTQVLINLGSKEAGYAIHVSGLLERAFRIPARQSRRARGYIDVYIGSTKAVHYLKKMGLRGHKVREQVAVPRWIFGKPEYQGACLRGLFDTDGSIYRLRHGWQISFCNRSMPLLRDAREMLLACGLHPSNISGFNLYISRKHDIILFARIIGFANPAKRAVLVRVGTEVVKPGTL